jgi:hypothetical protein
MEKNFDTSSDASLRPTLEKLVDVMAKMATVEEFERTLAKLCALKSPKAKKFAEYFVRTFIQRFSPLGWAYCYAQSAEERSHLTNNIAERFVFLLLQSRRKSDLFFVGTTGRSRSFAQVESWALQKVARV